jgi:enoyl-CoA hydratase/carnithine racemase
MLAEAEEGIGLITFNQPEKRNAMSVGMWAGLEQILDAFERDDTIRVVVLTGAGQKAFVGGADLGELAGDRADAAAALAHERRTAAGRARLAAFAKPTIARLRGSCLGEGLGIAMQCDLRIAGFDSQYGLPAVRMGMGYGFDMIERLVALIGPAHAAMLLLSGTPIDAAEAARIGLVNCAVQDEDLSEIVVELARTVADGAPLVLAAMKVGLREALKDAAGRDVAAIEAAMAACFDSADYREGCAAVREKREPRFIGR